MVHLCPLWNQTCVLLLVHAEAARGAMGKRGMITAGVLVLNNSGIVTGRININTQQHI